MTRRTRPVVDGRPRPARRPVVPAILVAAAHAAMVLAFAIGNPPWAAPDEPAQHTKALAVANGQLGRVPRYPYPPANYTEAWYRRQTRVVDLPPRLAPPAALPCFAFQPVQPAACMEGPAGLGPWALDAHGRAEQRVDTLAAVLSRLDLVAGADGLEIRTTTYQGVYPPFAVLVPGLAARAGSSPASSLRLGRLAAAAAAVVLFTAGTLVFAGGGGLRLVGPLLAVTPMAVFLGGMLNPSGTEIAAGYALLAALAALARPGPSRAPWVVALVGAAALVVSRPLGFLLLLLIAVAFAVVAGRRGLARLAGERPRRAVVAAVPVVALACTSIWWGAVVLPRPPDPGGTVAGRIVDTAGDLPVIAEEAVGVLGWLDVSLPPAVHWAWASCLVAVVVLGLGAGSRRARLALVGAVAGVVAATFVLSVFFAYSQQTRVQGRWVLPLAVGLPLLAVEVLARRPGALTPRALRTVPALVGGTVAASHLSALWANARRYAVGVDGPVWFLGRSEWAPEGGWGPVLVLGLAAGAAMVVAGVVPAGGPAKRRRGTTAA